jgi:hypothetical protein
MDIGKAFSYVGSSGLAVENTCSQASSYRIAKPCLKSTLKQIGHELGRNSFVLPDAE